MARALTTLLTALAVLGAAVQPLGERHEAVQEVAELHLARAPFKVGAPLLGRLARRVVVSEKRLRSRVFTKREDINVCKNVNGPRGSVTDRNRRNVWLSSQRR